MRPTRNTRPTRRRQTTPPPIEDERLAVIGRLGAEGDGVAADREGTFHVSGALPGETVVAQGSGTRYRATRIIDASPSRVAPPCPLSPTCGGCTFQHWDRSASLGWKTGRVAGALREAGYGDIALRPPISVDERTRRRMTLGFTRSAGGDASIGLRRRFGHEIVDMTECHILHSTLFALLAPLRRMLAEGTLPVSPAGGTLTANLLDNGPDLLLRTPLAPDAGTRARLARFAEANGVSRISWHRNEVEEPEPVAVLRRPALRFGDQVVEPAPGAFLQATETAERAIVADVVEAIGARRRSRGTVVELYSGSGTLTFPISALGRVRAYEGDRLAHATLARAAGGTRVTPVLRDLARAPVDAAELRDADAVVLDPPFDGAGRQIEAVAASGTPTVVLVSCNPAALAREAGVLREAGYALDGARTIDQFLHSARVESVSVFRRPR